MTPSVSPTTAGDTSLTDATDDLRLFESELISLLTAVLAQRLQVISHTVEFVTSFIATIICSIFKTRKLNTGTNQCFLVISVMATV